MQSNLNFSPHDFLGWWIAAKQLSYWAAKKVLNIPLDKVYYCSDLNFRMSYPYGYELYKRVDDPSFGKEKYNILTTFPNRPDVDEINDTFEGKPR